MRLGRGLERYDRRTVKEIAQQRLQRITVFRAGVGDREQPAVPDASGRTEQDMTLPGKHLHRRTFLRGLGAAIALPMLDAMRPALATAATAAATKPPVRLAFAYIPNGVTMKAWKPATAGADFEFTPILKPLEPFRKDLFVLSGLDHHNAESLGDGGGDHARAGACFLTGVHPKKTAGSDIQAGISVDQIAAQKLGSTTRISSLELGCEDSRTVGDCDSGYSCAYTNSISWRVRKRPCRRRPIRASCSNACSAMKISTCLPKRARAAPPSARAFWIW